MAIATTGTRALPSGTAVAASVVTVLLWGSSFAGFAVGLRGYTPGPMVLFRFLIASATLLLIARATRMRRPARADVPGLVGLGIVGVTVCQLAIVWGQQTVDAGTAGFLISLVPAATALLARFALGERLAPAGWGGIGLAVAGAALLVLGRGEEVGFGAGAAVILLAVASEAVYFVRQKPYLRRYGGLEVATWTLWGATLPLLVFLPRLPGEIAAAPAEATLAVAYLGVGPAALGYVAWSLANARMPASVAAMLLAVVPVVSLSVARVWLGEVPTTLSLAGGALSVAGVLLVTLRGRAGR